MYVTAFYISNSNKIIMTDTKLVITVIIILGILFVALSNHPSTKDFFDKFQTKVSIPSSSGPVNFEIMMSYEKLNSNVDNVDLDIYSNNINLTFDTGGFVSKENVKLYGYKGNVRIENKTLTLDGSFDKIESDTFSFAKTTNVKAIIEFENVSIDNFYTDKIEQNTTGTLTTQGVDTTINNKFISIEKPKGLFVLDDKLKIKGTAYKISIPDAKILVSG